MADPSYRVELTASFLERLKSIEAFLRDARAPYAGDALRAIGSGDYLLSIRHHRQLSFDFARLWPGAGRENV